MPLTKMGALFITLLLGLSRKRMIDWAGVATRCCILWARVVRISLLLCFYCPGLSNSTPQPQVTLIKLATVTWNKILLFLLSTTLPVRQTALIMEGLNTSLVYPPAPPDGHR
jgi:hypothetical protein